MKNILAISLVLFSTLAFADNHGEESSISSTFSSWWDKTKELGSAIWSETNESTAETAEKVEKKRHLPVGKNQRRRDCGQGAKQ